ncbi:hypothetical protein [Mesorhizobium sp. LNJC403B00]|uniref:hypothetical protein n=1 Tax=unclassified Mesorhizobium TaxID=325217 RepID=UPI000A004B22|nr:hypothetical protein [Mesorhizobium sp. LNJC403B00]
MAALFITTEAQKLLNNFDARIAQKEQKGKITTWEKSDDGKFYTHKSQGWAKKAWFKPVISSDRLTFNIRKPQNANVELETYAYYHGHLIETFLNHFNKDFSSAQATPKPTAADLCNS